MPNYEVGGCYLRHTGKIPNIELRPRYKLHLYGVQLHYAAVGCSKLGGNMAKFPGKVCRGRNYPIPHENQQSSLPAAVEMSSRTQTPAALVSSIQSFVNNKSTTLKMTP